MMKRQRVLAIIGGGCVGLMLGVVLGGFVGHFMISVEVWEDTELYGFIGLVRRVWGIMIGMLVGGVAGFLSGSWFGSRSPSDRDNLPTV